MEQCLGECVKALAERRRSIVIVMKMDFDVPKAPAAEIGERVEQLGP